MAATSNPSDDHERFLPLLLFWTPRGGKKLSYVLLGKFLVPEPTYCVAIS